MFIYSKEVCKIKSLSFCISIEIETNWFGFLYIVYIFLSSYHRQKYISKPNNVKFNQKLLHFYLILKNGNTEKKRVIDSITNLFFSSLLIEVIDLIIEVNDFIIKWIACMIKLIDFLIDVKIFKIVLIDLLIKVIDSMIAAI